MNPELKLLVLVVAELAGVLSAKPASAQVPASVQVQQSSPRPKGMPCRIIVKRRKFGREYVSAVYNLYYRRDGYLGVATEQMPREDCPEIRACWASLGPETSKLRYEYDAKGRLSTVTVLDSDGRSSRLDVAYAPKDRPSRYTWTQRFDGDLVNQSSTSIKYDTSGGLMSTTLKGRIFWGSMRQTEETARLTGGPGSFAAGVVWPDTPYKLYLGWRHQVLTVMVDDAFIGRWDETMVFDEEGRIQSGTLFNESNFDRRREFEYQCLGEGERAAEDVMLQQ